MKTFKDFITEAHSRGKFRGTRTPDEILELRQKRKEQQSISPHDTELSNKIIKATLRVHKDSLKNKNIPKSQLVSRMRFYQQRPPGLRTTTLDVSSNIATLSKRFQRHINKLKKQTENETEVLPSQHPDANFSSPEVAKKADKLHKKRRKARRKLNMPSREEYRTQRREEERQSRQRDRKFRRDELEKTVGQIPGQLRNR